MAMNLLQELHCGFGLTREQLLQGIVRRAGDDAGGGLTEQSLQHYLDGTDLPSWLNHLSARWIIEYWLRERDSCESAHLLAVDAKYTRLLKGFSMAQIIAMRNSVQVD